MEDAHISEAPFTDKKLALFGVFDGHGGTSSIMQEPSARSSWNGTSPTN